MKTDINLNIMIVGDTGVGKTNLTLRYIKDSFDETTPATIGADLF